MSLLAWLGLGAFALFYFFLLLLFAGMFRAAAGADRRAERMLREDKRNG